MRRLLAFAAMVALAALACLSTLNAAQRGSRPTPRPPVIRPPVIPNGGYIPGNIPRYNGIPRLPRNYRPGQGMRVVNATYTFTFTFNNDAGKVRSMSPPEEFDDKGNIKKHTREELQALKGDTPAEKKMVGYKSEISEVQTGDVVQVVLSVNKANLQKANKKEKDKIDLDDKEVKDGAKAKWVVAGQLVGRVTRVDTGNTEAGPKLTVQVTTQVVQGRGGNNGNRTQTINPDQGQATMVVIGKRATGGQGGVPVGKRNKKADN